jgi:hypothetical protein
VFLVLMAPFSGADGGSKTTLQSMENRRFSGV